MGVLRAGSSEHFDVPSSSSLAVNAPIAAAWLGRGGCRWFSSLVGVFLASAGRPCVLHLFRFQAAEGRTLGAWWAHESGFIARFEGVSSAFRGPLGMMGERINSRPGTRPSNLAAQRQRGLLLVYLKSFRLALSHAMEISLGNRWVRRPLATSGPSLCARLIARGSCSSFRYEIHSSAPFSRRHSRWRSTTRKRRISSIGIPPKWSP